MTSSIRTFALTLFGCAILLAGASGCDQAEGASTAASQEPVSHMASASLAVQDGQRLYNQACAACHGFTGQGMPRQGPTLQRSQYVAEHTDVELVEFIKTGRLPSDPKSIMKLQMPAKGTNPSLTDREIKQIVAFIRKMQEDADEGETASLGL